MPKCEFTKRFLKDMKKWKQSGSSMEPFFEFLEIAKKTWPPPAKYESHLMSGRFEGICNVHLRQNWVLFLKYQAGTVEFLRMGTHADLNLS